MNMDSNSPASHFGAKVNNYRSEAITQQEIAKELAEYIESSCDPKGVWVDIGSGPAVLNSYLYSKYPEIQPILLDISSESLTKAHRIAPSVSAVCGDMDSLPFIPNTIDTIVASSSIQWSSNSSELFRNIKTLLKSGGTAALAIFTEGTLDTLRKAQEKFNLPQPVHFCSHTEMKELLIENGFRIELESQTTKTEVYSSGFEALKAISRIGASHHSGKKLSPKELGQFVSFLETQSESPNIHKNIYEVSYFIAKVDA